MVDWGFPLGNLQQEKVANKEPAPLNVWDSLPSKAFGKSQGARLKLQKVRKMEEENLGDEVLHTKHFWNQAHRSLWACPF